MKRIFKKILPVLVSLLLVVSVVTIAWVVQESYISGISVSSVSEGTEIQLKINGFGEFTTDLTMDSENLQLKPCTYSETYRQFSDENYDYVTNNTSYVKAYTLLIKPEKRCHVTAYKAIDGSLPIGVVINGVEVTEEGADIGEIATPYQDVSLQFYIDGNQITRNGTGTVQITLQGE